MGAMIEITDFIDFRLDGFDSAQPRAKGPLAVVFWRIGCSTSRLTAPFFDRLQKAYPFATVVGICQEARADIDAYMQENKLSFRQAADEKLQVSRKYRIQIVPTYFLTDASGKILESGNSWDAEAIERFSTRIAKAGGVEPVEIVRDTDGVPAFKPG